ncbi:MULTISPECIES: STAS domain-containing protein [unclassified Sphingomonas]|jgi:chemotaxis protein CheX|uniref:STAS domain-containing protein n=1 Tax=unclassified Sphingomonas TaxID=196159 RepID=UPI00226A260C|nr:MULTISPECIES: STAS domain-containing protein [unclassified Sphingomonas]
MTDPYPLGTSLDTAAAGPLRAALLGLVERRQPMLLDGAGVARVGIACLQVLASARATAAADGLGYHLADASEPLAAMATLAGLAVVLDPVSSRDDR